MLSFKNTERMHSFKNTKIIHSFKNTKRIHSFKNTNFELKFFTYYFQTDQCLSIKKSSHMIFIIKNQFLRKNDLIKYI